MKTRVLWLAALVLAFVGVAASSARADGPGGGRERWYVIELAGAPAGWMVSTQSAAGGKITTGTRMMLEIRRGEMAVKMELSNSMVETEAGEPVSVESRTKLGASPVTQRVTFKGGRATSVTEQGGQKIEQELDLGEGWLMPAAAERFVRERVAAKAGEVTVKTLDASTGVRVVEITRRGFEPAEIELGGTKVKATRTVSTMSGMPGMETTEWVDDEGVPLRVETSMMGIGMVMRASTREEATGLDAAEMPELMVRTFVKPDRAIEGPRQTRRASYVIGISRGTLPAMPTAASQRVETLEGGRVRVVVDIDNPAPAAAGDAEDARYLASTSTINAGDAEIARLKGLAVRDAGEDPAARAEAIRRFVFSYIRKKGLGVGFATASEVARGREGDCTEHAVLLAALLRADGIPARTASGLVYADQFAGQERIFGYHMWAQALLPTADGGRAWVDLDAALSETLPTDATHIALSVSALGDGELQEGFASMAGMMGSLSISVEEAR